MSKEQENKIVRGTRAETWDVPPSDEDYTLEEILAEYGSSRQQKILEEVDRELQPETAEEPAPPAEPVTEEPAKKEPPQEAAPKSARELWARRMATAEQERAAEAGEDMPEEPDEEPEESRFLSL